MVKHRKIKHSLLSKVESSISVFFVLLTIVFFVTLGYKIFELKYQDRFYPGVFVGEEEVGGQTYDEVFKHFKEKAGNWEKDGLNAHFMISRGIYRVNIPMSATGLTPDNSVEFFSITSWENTLREAYAWGHKENLFLRLKEQTTLLFKNKKFNFTNSIRREAVDSFLEHEVYNFLKKSIPASFYLVENKINIFKETPGEIIDREGVLNNLEKKLIYFDTTPTFFSTNYNIPNVTKEKLEPFLEFIQKFSENKRIVFQYKGHEWKVSRAKLATWFTIDKENSLTIDTSMLEAYLSNTTGKLINNPTQNSRFQMQKGKLVELLPGKSGNAIDINHILYEIKKNIKENDLESNNNIYISIQTIETEPKVTKETVEKYRILDLVGEIRTSFAGSSTDREHNIKIGVATINGILIAPGVEFSTVSTIGHVSAQEGYVKEMVIKENRTTKEYGGGLCQIATTLFRLALNAGLPITERINHRFVVHYYDPPGLDATIYGPHPDLRFVNDTGNYLLLQARVEGKQVIMELYGQQDSRSVEISKPIMYNPIPAPETKLLPSSDLLRGQTKCTEAPHDGITTDVLYTVRYPDGSVKENNFHSLYQPWQKVCLFGTAAP